MQLGRTVCVEALTYIFLLKSQENIMTAYLIVSIIVALAKAIWFALVTAAAICVIKENW